MDSFEQVIAEILWREGYWVRTSVKVELTKEEKRQIQLPSAPRWELDVVAYKAQQNSLLVVECKSYLDSPGVKMHGFDGSNEKAAGRFKLFNKSNVRDVVFNRLRTQLAEIGACSPSPSVTLCLACGRIASERDRSKLKEHFAEQGWQFWDEFWLRDRLKSMAAGGYENQVSAVVSKLLLRGRAE
ncbi:hypothetical protein [Bradyrhizobium canariense]|uniref:Restriction endonuclease type IV Mrr domain-containing protein n=1 Tax=Bradyrhizobium canariense TaxID=255045 RepID=A0A1X3HFK4_9BRAD|nr:hypothetical protein [Bradyrhizobium canariense]OSI79522.1 hypothetical protein BSZ22_01720 [Bradyrhizobium canariense]OSI82402.1 hypothetical protein BSZ23_01685 [Bradyrhizobium canariense]OSI96804.1 hypothetical protein BSZ25_01345 [Bradyrhizobium canariense]OSI98824.1 hypothetical protein BSZ24_01290 [Bradyrhizobium canariense]OSJ16100.1 hypothetical protein BSZ16_01385 [Bradyrhizobium canariense]